MRSRNPIWLGALALCLPLTSLAAEVEREVAERVNDLERLAVEAEPINDFIYKLEGQGAIFLINTSEGAVLVDTGFDNHTSVKQKVLIDQLATGPVKKIIVTHSHQDHAGGLIGKPLEALRLLDIAAGNANEMVLRTRIDVLSRLLGDAQAGLNNYSEVEYLKADIRNAEAKLAK